MTDNITHRQPSPGRDSKPKFRDVLLGDLRRGDFNRTLRRDLQDLYRFYLDDETRARLTGMGRFKRWLFLALWLLRSLFLKLSPARRILVLMSLFFAFFGEFTFRQGNLQIGLNLNYVGFLLLLVILMLELKDKLLAREELEVGRTVQAALMPPMKPEVPGWDIWLFTRPAMEVGGDMVDYLKLGPDRMAFAMGDIAGKGLGAALLMAKLQATLRALASDFESLAVLGERLNAIFCRDGLRSRFATLLYAETSPQTGHVRILNAGHLPPISLTGDSIHRLPRVSPALGIVPTATFIEQQIELQAGGLLVVYSDGLTEARNEQGEFFGDQRLLELLPACRGLSAEAAGALLLTEVDRFVGGARPNDDLSLILVKRKPS